MFGSILLEIYNIAIKNRNIEIVILLIQFIRYATR